MTPSENRIHYVFAKGYEDRPWLWRVCKTYLEAHQIWRKLHHWKKPYVIMSLGRTIEPDTPIVDVNE